MSEGEHTRQVDHYQGWHEAFLWLTNGDVITRSTSSALIHTGGHPLEAGRNPSGEGGCFPSPHPCILQTASTQ